MLIRPTVLALILVAGTAAAAPAQSDEYPFRRFRMGPAPHLRFSLDDSFHWRNNTDRFRTLVERSRRLADVLKRRQLTHSDREFALRNRAFDRIDRAHRRGVELRLRGMDRLKERLDHLKFDRFNFNRFNFDRPIRIRRHSRVI